MFKQEKKKWPRDTLIQSFLRKAMEFLLQLFYLYVWKTIRFFLPGIVFGQGAELNPNPDNGTVRIQSRIRIRMIGLFGSRAESESGLWDRLLVPELNPNLGDWTVQIQILNKSLILEIQKTDCLIALGQLPMNLCRWDSFLWTSCLVHIRLASACFWWLLC